MKNELSRVHLEQSIAYSAVGELAKNDNVQIPNHTSTTKDLRSARTVVLGAPV